MELAMNKLSKLVWIGLIINILWLGIILYMLSQLTAFYSELDRATAMLVDVLQAIKIPLIVSLGLQIISLLLLFKLPKFGTILAGIGSILMLPLSFVFIAGYMLSYEKQVNRHFALFSESEANKISQRLSFKLSTFILQGSIFLVMGLVIVFIGMSFGGILAGTGIVFICNGLRLKEKTMIGVSGDQLIITPSLYAQAYRVPLKDVKLLKENKNIFKLHIQSGDVDRKATFNKKMIAEENYEQVLKDIFLKLAKPDTADNTASDHQV